MSSGPFAAVVQGQTRPPGQQVSPISAGMPSIPPPILRTSAGGSVSSAPRPGLIGGSSPEPDDSGTSAARRVTVPLSHPRYERKTRLNRAMAVTDSASEAEGGNTTGRSDPTTLMTGRSTESLTVRHGPITHGETIKYSTYACYKHGGRVHTQSVGYSSDHDLVLHRRDIVTTDAESGSSLPRGADDSMANGNDRRGRSASASTRRVTGVEGAVCLNPRARPIEPKVNGEEPTGRWAHRVSRLPKYPGVKCPKNRKTRNRLINDHLTIPSMRKLFDAAHEDSDPDGMREPAAPHFTTLPQDLAWLADTTEKKQEALLGRVGLAGTTSFSAVGGGKRDRAAAAAKPSIDSAFFRFQQLQSRVKSELQHAMSTDFMPGFIDDLETRLETLVSEDAASADLASTKASDTSIEVRCRDGYGRLITHGVASFYKLNSASANAADGQRVTVVSLPKKRVPLPEQRLASHLRGERPTNVEPPGGSPATDAASSLPTSPAVAASAAPTAKRNKMRSMATAQLTAAETAAADADDDDGEAGVEGRRRRFKRRAVRRFILTGPSAAYAAAATAKTLASPPVAFTPAVPLEELGADML